MFLRLWITLVLISFPLAIASYAGVVGMTDIETAILKQDYLTAEKLSEKFLSNQPSKTHTQQAQYYLALSRLRQGQYKEAHADFIKIKKENLPLKLRDRVYFGLADVYYLQEDYQKSGDILQEFLVQNPKSEALSLIYLKLAKVNLKLGLWAQAQDHLTKIIRSYPHSLETLMAKQLLEEKQYFTVQVGAFKEKDLAEQLVMELKQKEEYAYIVETIDVQNKKFYRVRVGQLTVPKDAQKVKSRLDQLGYPAQIYP